MLSRRNSLEALRPASYRASRHAIGSETKAWVALFDKITPAAVKEKIAATFREEFANRAPPRGRSLFAPEILRLLPKGTVVLTVMVGGYSFGREAYSILHAESISDTSVQLSYSSGLHNERFFSDGATSMAGSIYITAHDLKILEEHAGSPLVIVDVTKDTGLTSAVVGNSLKCQLRYLGQMYELYTDRGFTKWDGYIYSDKARSFPTNVPIITERGNALLQEMKSRRL